MDNTKSKTDQKETESNKDSKESEIRIDRQETENKTDINETEAKSKSMKIKPEKATSSTENNLEKYLCDVFVKECSFSIDESEVNFIQSGIETLVQKMAEMIREEGHEDLQKCIHVSKELNPHLVEIQNNNNIIKVGSFYEGTRNCFPDDFDIIFLISTFYSERIEPYWLDLDSPELDFPITEVNADTFEKVCNMSKDTLSYTDFPSSQRKRVFDDYVQEHGPAFQIQFMYSNQIGEDRIIDVDFVSAFKIVDSHIEKNATKWCQLDQFRSELIFTGSYLWVNENITFTETEVNFMKNILSLKHVIVYKILKYLINGHGEDEILAEFNVRGYPSYKIKTTVIYHHYKCKNQNTGDKSQCLLDILDDLYAFKDHPCSLVRETYFPVKASKEFTESLKVTTRLLKQMKMSQDSYNYEQNKIKSVCRQLFDSKNQLLHPQILS